MTNALIDYLADEARLGEQLDRLIARRRRQMALQREDENGLSLSALSRDRRGFLHALRQTFLSGAYRPEPAMRSVVQLDKPRMLYRFTVADTIVQAVLARAIAEGCEAKLAPQVYSYRKGRSERDAVQAFRLFRQSHAQRSHRELAVLRFDVATYTESIATAAGSPLWTQLRDALERFPWNDETAVIVQACVRTNYWQAAGQAVALERGIPTGSPLGPAIANLHLMDLDEALSKIPGGFYARFGDDILFAHADASVAVAADALADAAVGRLNLQFNAKKRARLWLSGSGAARPERNDAGFRVAQSVDFVGFRLEASGRFSLKEETERRFLSELANRLANVKAQLPAGEPLAEALVHVTNASIDPSHPLSIPEAGRLLGSIDDRKHLRRLDLAVAALVAKRSTGQPTKSAFRDLPFATLRGSFGLRSLVQLRNRKGHSGA